MISHMKLQEFGIEIITMIIAEMKYPTLTDILLQVGVMITIE